MGEKILVAYDGSELSKEALEEGKLKLSQEEDSELTVISVVSIIGPGTNAIVQQSIIREMSNDLKQELNTIQESFAKEDLHIHMDVLIDHGQRNPAHQVCNYAKDHDTDLIIVGSRGLSGVKKLFLGSVSNSIVQHAPCRVLVIK